MIATILSFAAGNANHRSKIRHRITGKVEVVPREIVAPVSFLPGQASDGMAVGYYFHFGNNGGFITPIM